MTREAIAASEDSNLPWWKRASEKVIVAVATAFVTGVVTIAGPGINDWIFSIANDTGGVSEDEAEFQRITWISNKNCANTQPVWHDTSDGYKIDATICPETGDILLVLKDSNGRLFQWWNDNRRITDRFGSEYSSASALLRLLESPANAAVKDGRQNAGFRIAQSVLCQIMLPDNRGLRRRLLVGPNQCVEIIIDTWTGRVVSQRRIPCNSNCAVNV